MGLAVKPPLVPDLLVAEEVRHQVSLVKAEGVRVEGREEKGCALLEVVEETAGIYGVASFPQASCQVEGYVQHRTVVVGEGRVAVPHQFPRPVGVHPSRRVDW